jgi:hypothetical protein
MYRMRGLTLRRISFGVTLAALAVLLIWPVKARVARRTSKPVVACACCTDEGAWYQRTERSDLTQLDRVRMATAANKYSGPGDEGELASNYSLTHTRNGRRWQLRFRDEQGKTGTLSFLLPPNLITFGADLHDSEPGGLGPLLYQEWRLAGTAQAAGFFKSIFKGPARFQLILQGRGRGCIEAENFKHWTLQLSDAKDTYSFYGALDKPE